MDQKTQSSNGKKDLSLPSAKSPGHYLLSDWQKSQPDNLYAYDKYLQRSLEFFWGMEQYKLHAAQLFRFGETLAQSVDPLVTEMSLQTNLPSLERYDSIGKRTESVTFHPNHSVVGRHIYNSGMLSAYQKPGNNLYSLALFYLSSQLGEAGHNCAIACTTGLIKVLQSAGSSKLQKEYLPLLLNDNYDDHFSGGQFLTEIQGGSDVGANNTKAKPLNLETGTWLLSGEKWFCSNITADLALVTARVPGQGDGTSGLGLFMMPRRLPDGQLNNFFIQRLKNKLGTRSLATAEVEFREAVAFQVGRLEDGFKNVMAYVLNISRIHNAVASCGVARRAYLVASSFAVHRHAFGRPIVQFPLVQDILANMRADYMASLAGTLHIVQLQDELELNFSSGMAEDFLRLAVNLNKYRSAEIAHQVIMNAIEVLGGNGTIETFSILPRLLRDNIVYEKWEGTANILLAQSLRDIRRYRYDHPFITAVRALLASVSYEDFKQNGSEQLKLLELEIDEILVMDELTGGIYFRSWAKRLIDLYYATCLANEGQWELENKQDKTKLRVASLYLGRRALGLKPKDIAYYDDQVSRLCV